MLHVSCMSPEALCATADIGPLFARILQLLQAVYLAKQTITNVVFLIGHCRLTNFLPPPFIKKNKSKKSPFDRVVVTVVQSLPILICEPYKIKKTH